MWFPPFSAHPAPSLLRSRNHAGKPRLYALPSSSLHFNASPITPHYKDIPQFCQSFSLKKFHVIYISISESNSRAFPPSSSEPPPPQSSTMKKASPGGLAFYIGQCSRPFLVLRKMLRLSSHSRGNWSECSGIAWSLCNSSGVNPNRSAQSSAPPRSSKAGITC